MVLIALLSMMVLVTANHLGLSEAVSSVLSKVLRCPKCLSFWGTLFILLYLGEKSIVAVGLSVAISYLSHWFGLLLIFLNKKYNQLWERINKGR